MNETAANFTFGTLGIFFLIGIISLGMWGCPTYKVWQKGKAGEAQLMEARQNRQISIEEAQARLEAERLNAKSEVERAKGMAEAMKIENNTLTPAYNQYLFIRSLEKLADKGDLPQIIYLPSEGMLPVMDLNKHSTSTHLPAPSNQ